MPDDYSFTGDSLVVWEDNRRVYFLEETDFYLMYDFSLEKGDTMTYYDPVNRGYFSAGNNISPTGAPVELKLVIEDITEMQLESGSSKKFFKLSEEVMIGAHSEANCIRFFGFIEDVGSLGSSLTGGQCQFVADGCVGGLHCYSSSVGEYISSYDFLMPNPDCVTLPKSFAPLDAVWNYEGWSEFCEGNHMQFRVVDETVVDGRECSVIAGHGDSLIVNENAGKVYFLQDSLFYLLYDFTLDVGDTLSHYYPVNQGIFSSYLNAEDDSDPLLLKSLITEVGEVELSGVLRKTLVTEPLAHNDNLSTLGTIIEGIGSTSEALTGELCCIVADGCFGSLQCYSDTTLEYQGLASQVPHPECSYPDAVNELDVFMELAVFPNPVHDYLYLEGIERDFRVGIYDIGLRLLSEYRNEYVIRVHDLEEGPYVFMIESDGVFKYFKVIKK